MQEQTGLTHCLSRKAIFFPQGKDDPDLVLIRVEIERAEYWDGPGTIAGKIFSLAAAAITGNPGVMTDNAKVEPVSAF